MSALICLWVLSAVRYSTSLPTTTEGSSVTSQDEPFKPSLQLTSSSEVKDKRALGRQLGYGYTPYRFHEPAVLPPQQHHSNSLLDQDKHLAQYNMKYLHHHSNYLLQQGKSAVQPTLNPSQHFVYLHQHPSTLENQNKPEVQPTLQHTPEQDKTAVQPTLNHPQYVNYLHQNQRALEDQKFSVQPILQPTPEQETSAVQPTLNHPQYFNQNPRALEEQLMRYAVQPTLQPSQYRPYLQHAQIAFRSALMGMVNPQGYGGVSPYYYGAAPCQCSPYAPPPLLQGHGPSQYIPVIVLQVGEQQRRLGANLFYLRPQFNPLVKTETLPTSEMFDLQPRSLSDETEAEKRS